MTDSLHHDPKAFDEGVAPLRDALHELVTLELELRQRRRLLPAPDSDAMRELAGGEKLSGREPWGSNPVQDAQFMVTALLYSAEDHILAALRQFHPGPNPVYAHLSLARVAFEASLTARWLLEGLRPNANERVARYMSFRLDDLAERRKLTALMNEAEAAKATEWSATILAEAERLGLPLRRKGERALGLVPMLPSTLDLAKDFLLSGPGDDSEYARKVGVILWRYYSGVTHSKWYALRQGMEEAGDVPDAHVPGTTTAAYVTRLNEVLQSFGVSLLAYMPACGLLHAYMGWDEPERKAKAAEAFAMVRALFRPPS